MHRGRRRGRPPITAGGQRSLLLGSVDQHTLCHDGHQIQRTRRSRSGTDPSTGAYSFSLLGQIDHPGHDADGLNNGPHTAYEDNININLTYTVTDRDGDTATVR